MGAVCAQGARRVGVDFEILISFTVFRSLEDHFELYNLDIDPGETNDLAKSKTKVYECHVFVTGQHRVSSVRETSYFNSDCFFQRFSVGLLIML